MIQGLHHVSFKTMNDAQYETAKQFYTKILGLRVLKECEVCILMDTGDGIVEIFRDGSEDLPKGTIRHFAFAVDDVDSIVSKVKEAGCTVFVEPKDVCIGGDPLFPARIAFCTGPLGEEIEFFHQKW
ncbi:MAG: VOC family protein [Oscillospiraceae bacterium]|nr:VOC family protein [Oscillospiraceae bacterium]